MLANVAPHVTQSQNVPYKSLYNYYNIHVATKMSNLLKTLNFILFGKT